MLEWGDDLTREAARIDALRLSYPRFECAFRDDGAIQAYASLLGMQELFRHSQKPQGARWRHTLSVENDWYLSGTVEFSPLYRGRWSSTEVQLDLNPTRLRAYKDAPITSLDWDAPRRLLSVPTRRRRSRIDRTFDQNDNILPANDWAQSYDVVDFTTNYLRAAQSVVGEELVDTSDTALGAPEGASVGELIAQAERVNADWDYLLRPDWTGWAVRRLEVYWEFRADDALALLYRLASAARAASHECVTRYFDRPPPEDGGSRDQPRWRTRFNAFIIEIPAGREGVSIVVYAKQRQRLRVEVRFEGSLRGLVRGDTSERACPSNMDGLTRLLNMALDDALERASVVIGVMRDTSAEPSVSPETLNRLLTVLAQTGAEFPDSFPAFVSALISTGGVTVEQGTADARLASRLAYRRIVVRTRMLLNDRGRRRYVLANQYQRLLNQLRPTDVFRGE